MLVVVICLQYCIQYKVIANIAYPINATLSIKMPKFVHIVCVLSTIIVDVVSFKSPYFSGTFVGGIKNTILIKREFIIDTIICGKLYSWSVLDNQITKVDTTKHRKLATVVELYKKTRNKIFNKKGTYRGFGLCYRNMALFQDAKARISTNWL